MSEPRGVAAGPTEHVGHHPGHAATPATAAGAAAVRAERDQASDQPLGERRTEIRSLTGLRWFASLWVVLFHFHFTPSHHFGWISRPVLPWVQAGGLGVDLFYVLSGFVITHTYLSRFERRHQWRRTTVAFVWARICRMWPAYVVVTNLFGVWVLVRHLRHPGAPVVYQTVQPPVTVWMWVKQMFMVQLWPRAYFDGASWVGPAWSVSAEWFVYLLFPLVTVWILFLAAKLPSWALLVGSVLAVLPFGLLGVLTGTPYHPYSWMLRVCGGFLAGALAYLGVRKTRRTPRVHLAGAVIAPLAVIGIGLEIWVQSHHVGDRTAGAVLLFPVLVTALAVSDRFLSRLCSTRWAVHGGRISFSLYLVHVPIFEIFWVGQLNYGVLSPDRSPGWWLVPFLVPAVVLAAHLLWKFVEEPSRLFLRRHDPSRRMGARPTIATADGVAVPPAD